MAAAPYMPTKAALEDWTTSEDELVLVREVFDGPVAFDPCGNPYSVVGATKQVWLPRWTVEEPETPERPGHPAFTPGPDVIVGDGLEVAWDGPSFVNPAFNAKTLGLFLEKAAAEARRGVPALLLTKVKTGIRAWKPFAGQAAAIAFADHRLTYGGGEGDTAPFDSCMLLFTDSRALVHRFAAVFEGWGDVMFHGRAA
jgi:hypothetical protein